MLLLIPLKTSDPLDLTTCLSKWVDTSHPRYSSPQIITEIKRLHSLRADITKTICTDTSHAYAFDVKNNNRTLQDLIEYHACLVACTEKGFPVCGRDAKVNGTIDANLQFSWKNAFDDHEENTLSEETKSHFNYEIVCVLWNIAALLTYKASTLHEWDTKENLSLVKKEYETSALIFSRIKDILKKAGTKSNGITSDLTDASLDMCQYLCLAQGQVCLYEVLKQKLTTSASSATYTLIAQISMGTAEIYDRALTASQSTDIKFNESSKMYGAHCKSLSMLFKARAEYLQSMVERQFVQYGVEVARLRRCLEMVNDGIDFTKSNGKQSSKIVFGPASLGKSSLAVLKSLKETVKQRLNLVSKENDTIYHEKVPSDDNLPKVVGKDMITSNVNKSSGDPVDLPVEYLPQSLARPMFV